MSEAASRRAFLIAALLAALASRWLYGLRALDPRSADWLLHGDPAQHYIGSVFFRAEAWHWPPGLITGFGEPPTSLVFADAIPLLALPAKLAGLAPGLQYFGLWMLACHVLAAVFGVSLLVRLGARPAAAVAGALLLAFTPMLLMRAYGHEALMAHFLILAALRLGLASWRWRGWLLLGAAALLVHPYLVAMVGVLGLAAAGAALQRGELRWPGLLAGAAMALVLATGLAWLAGYFIAGPERSAAGFGIYSANLLSWFDPMDWDDFLRTWQRSDAHAGEWSRLFPALPQATQGQYEGFAWLGAGGLLCVMVALGLALTAALRRRGRALARDGASPAQSFAWEAARELRPQADGVRIVWLLAGCLAMAVFALSSRPSLGAQILVDLPLPALLERLSGVFRASGRFVWPLTLLLLAWALARVGAGRRGAVVIVAALLLQAWDMQDKLSELRHRFRTGPAEVVAPANAPLWAEVFDHCPRLVFVAGRDPVATAGTDGVVSDATLSEAAGSGAGAWIGPTLAAARAGAHVASAPTARLSAEAVQRERERSVRLHAGQGWRADTVYLLSAPFDAATPDRLAARARVAGVAAQPVRADGFQLIVPDACRAR